MIKFNLLIKTAERKNIKFSAEGKTEKEKHKYIKPEKALCNIA